ncbi:16790_t:CDS:2, partial [Acaulospora morrowiae]
DKPTLDLNSVTLFEMCIILKSIAYQQELMIIAIIHSPSPQLFNIFDDFMLLGKGGMIIYFADRLQNILIFMMLGVTFCGINTETITFGYEKVMYLRDMAAGIRTVLYFLAKVVTDIPQILLTSLMYSLALILFYAYQALFYKVYLIVLLCYMATWEKLGLAAKGLALVYGLILNDATSRLELVMSDNTYKFLRWL